MSVGGAPSKPSSTSYVSDSWDDDGAHFVHTFSKYTELIGFSQAKLFMYCADTDDLDVYVNRRKLDAAGKPLVQLNIPLEALPAETTAEDVPDLNFFKYLGPNGRLRASHRELSADPTLSKESSLDVSSCCSVASSQQSREDSSWSNFLSRYTAVAFWNYLRGW